MVIVGSDGKFVGADDRDNTSIVGNCTANFSP